MKLIFNVQSMATELVFFPGVLAGRVRKTANQRLTSTVCLRIREEWVDFTQILTRESGRRAKS